MAKFTAILPNDVIKDVNWLMQHSEYIIKEMTRAGAEVVANTVMMTVPDKALAQGVKLSKTYFTPTDGGINTKVYMSGYLPFTPPRSSFTRRGANGSLYTTTKGVPIPFLANLYEYGRSGNPWPKKPFFRKAFKGAVVIEHMLKVQKQLSKGLLE